MGLRQNRFRDKKKRYNIERRTHVDVMGLDCLGAKQVSLAHIILCFYFYRHVALQRISVRPVQNLSVRRPLS